MCRELTYIPGRAGVSGLGGLTLENPPWQYVTVEHQRLGTRRHEDQTQTYQEWNGGHLLYFWYLVPDSHSYLYLHL